jgi:nucleotidyltransferase/DNA polymerase involved in DNA repair
MKKKSSIKSELLSLMNIGPAMQKDFTVLGITTIAQLAQANADELYERLQKITKQKHDPCVWDVFAAAIHEAKTGKKTPWWHWTPLRKARKH